MTLITETGTWIRRYRTAHADATTLVCFPHAGGSASFFAPIAHALAPSVEVLALQYPGRQDRRREPTIESIPRLADEAFDALRGSVGPAGRRFAFFGHSMGATIAFEVALRLEREVGAGPVMLWASARRAPSIPPDSAVHRLDDDGLVAELRRLDGTDAALLVDEDLLRSFLPAIRGDYKAIETYSCPPDTRLACPVTVFVGDADPLTSPEQARAWQAHTAGEFALRTFPGGHFYLSRRAADVIDAVRAGL
jgi:surfactin synthase thioesterase subunit